MISCRVLFGSGIEHKAYVLTTVSIDSDSTDNLLADSIKNSIFKLFLSALFLAIVFSSLDGSTPSMLITLSVS